MKKSKREAKNIRILQLSAAIACVCELVYAVFLYRSGQISRIPYVPLALILPTAVLLISWQIIHDEKTEKR